LLLPELLNLRFVNRQLLSELCDSDVKLIDMSFIMLFLRTITILLAQLCDLLIQLSDLSLVNGELLSDLGDFDVELVDDQLAFVVLGLPFIGDVDLTASALQYKDSLIESSDFSIFLNEEGAKPFDLNPACGVSPLILEQKTQSISLISQEGILPDKHGVILNNFGAK
jgi:hypothetical protein